jgi:hypothetical protein
MYSLPQPSVNHRHKAIPIFREVDEVERLIREPILFGDNETIGTNNFTYSSRLTDRLNKAHGYNVGAGPLWDLLEDRGWYKERVRRGEQLSAEAMRRPRVYDGINIYCNYSIMNERYAFMLNNFCISEVQLSVVVRWRLIFRLLRRTVKAPWRSQTWYLATLDLTGARLRLRCIF